MSNPLPSDQPADLAVGQGELATNFRMRKERQLKVTFFVTLALGLIGGGYFQSWEIPSIAVCSYAVIGWKLTQHEANIERFADSLYYMGFLFTIWGLLFAFSPWSSHVENLDSKTIITQFGIKLVTTVIALTARIILVQARASVAEETEEIRQTLGSLADQMTREIDEIIKGFREARDRMLAQADAGVTDLHREAMRRLESDHGEFRARAEKLLADVSTTINDLVTRLSTIEVPQDLLSSRLNSAANDITAEMDGLRTNISKSSAGIAEALAGGLERVSQSTDHMDAAIKNFHGFEQLAKESDAAVRNMAAASAALQDTFERTNRVLNELAIITGRLQDATQQDITKIRDSIGTVGSDIQLLGNTIRQDTRGFTSAMTEGVAALRKVIQQQ